MFINSHPTPEIKTDVYEEQKIMPFRNGLRIRVSESKVKSPKVAPKVAPQGSSGRDAQAPNKNEEGKPEF